MREQKRRKRLVLGVTGSIASYKAAEIARHFMKRGYSVRVVMTESAGRFISPLTFQALTGNPVNTSLWAEDQPGAIGHIELADWADVVLIAPATADCIAKMAMGVAESNLLAVVLATKAPVVVAPAMNVNMYENPTTQENLESLMSRGIVVVEPDSGRLACGWTGQGRLASSSEIFFQVERAIGPNDLLGKRVLISAGPTREAIDPVRFLSNRSSGKMGIAMAREAFRRGGNVTLVCGPLGSKPLLPSGVKYCPITSASEMHETIMNCSFDQQGNVTQEVVIMAAAVADFRPIRGEEHKIKKGAGAPELELVPNADILAELGLRRGSEPKPILVGFAVETQGESALIEEAKGKLNKKKADFIIGNLAKDSFDRDTNRVWIVSPREVVELETASKKRISRGIWDRIVKSFVKR